MAFNTRGLSWISPNASAAIRDFRNTSERLGFKGSVHPDIWAEIERDHIRASANLCHFIATLEQRAERAKRQPVQRWEPPYEPPISSITKREEKKPKRKSRR